MTWSLIVIYAIWLFVFAFLIDARYDCSKRISGRGGKERRRGTGRITSEGIVEEADEREVGEVGDARSAGIFCDAAVEGLMSCVGEGSRLIESDWIAEATDVAGLTAMFDVKTCSHRPPDRSLLCCRYCVPSKVQLCFKCSNRRPQTRCDSGSCLLSLQNTPSQCSLIA